MTSRVLAVLAGGIVLAAVAVVLLIDRPSAPERVTAPPVASLAPTATTAGDYAKASCVRLRLVRQGIAADSPAEVVRRELAAARVLAAEALRRDGRWAALSGGVAALDEALRRDEGQVAADALRVALEQCQGLS